MNNSNIYIGPYIKCKRVGKDKSTYNDNKFSDLYWDQEEKGNEIIFHYLDLATNNSQDFDYFYIENPYSEDLETLDSKVLEITENYRIQAIDFVKENHKHILDIFSRYYLKYTIHYGIVHNPEI
ncbi:MAG: hypothetical protein ACRCZ2_13595 [Fusobacteriaceae bacterium]